MTIDHNGIPKDAVSNQLLLGNINFKKADIVEINIENPKANYIFAYNVTKKRTEYEVIPVFTGKTEPKITLAAETVKIAVILDRSGTSYQLKITRYDKKDFTGRRGGVVISEFNCRTNPVYYFGAHVGAFIPLVRKNTYGIKPLPDQAPFTGPYGLISKKSAMEYNAIFIGAVYPFGFEPGLLFPSNYGIDHRRHAADFFKNIYKLIHFDLAFELSKNIFSKLYFGGGLSFGLCSFSFLACYQKADDIGLHLGNNQVVPGIMLIVSPVRERYRWSYGVSVSLPIDFAFSWIGYTLK